MAYQGRGKGGGGGGLLLAFTARFWISTVGSGHSIVLLPWLVPRETAVVSLHVQYTPYNRAPIYSVIVSWFGPAVRR